MNNMWLKFSRTCNIVKNTDNNELHDSHEISGQNHRSLKKAAATTAEAAPIVAAATNATNLHLKLSSSVNRNSKNLSSDISGSSSNISHFNRGDNASTISVSDRLNGVNEKSDEVSDNGLNGGGGEESEDEVRPDGPEVFLGGSCNPTTWRADVAIPTLNQLGISFYNPQVSDWTPDLIELEHRAKEKARVLFFVMDSETRASAGAIEAAHIAGQNTKQLVVVLHPYKPDQKILNEPISKQ